MPFGSDSLGPETMYYIGSTSPKRKGPFRRLSAQLKSIGRLLRCTQKRLKRSRCRLGSWLIYVPRNLLDRVKVGRIHSPPRGVKGWRCGLSSKFFNYLSFFHRPSLDDIWTPLFSSATDSRMWKKDVVLYLFCSQSIHLEKMNEIWSRTRSWTLHMLTACSRPMFNVSFNSSHLAVKQATFIVFHCYFCLWYRLPPYFTYLRPCWTCVGLATDRLRVQFSAGPLSRNIG